MLALLLVACAPVVESATTTAPSEDGLRSWSWSVDCSEPATTSPPMPTDRPLIAQVVYWQDEDGDGVTDRAVNSPYTLTWSDETGGGLSSADLCTDGVLGGALTVLY